MEILIPIMASCAVCAMLFYSALRAGARADEHLEEIMKHVQKKD